MNNNLDFSLWLTEQHGADGFYYLGDGLFRYKYLSPFTIEEMFNIYNKTKQQNG